MTKIATPDDNNSKDTYVAPHLTVYGDLIELTASGSNQTHKENTGHNIGPFYNRP